MSTYEDLVAEAVAAPLSGRDLKYLDGRMIEASTPWSFPDRASELVTGADGPVLDMSAGSGEFEDIDAEALPFPDDRYAVVLNKHDPYHAGEVRRVLRRGGVFLTEQVGGLDGLAINEALGAPLPSGSSEWALSPARAELEAAGLEVNGGRTAFPERLFHDVGALIYFLRAVPRQVPDFSVEHYDKELRLLHDQMSAAEPFRDRAVRFLVEAVRP
ncbi:MAG: hypothetical protein ACRDTU_12045 [Micromonosporaceae bacterium]